MRILFLSTENPFPPDHGHHIRTYHTLKCLAAKHQIHFFGFTQNEDGLRHQEKLLELCETVDIFRLHYRGWRQAVLALRNVFSQKPLIAQKYYQKDAAQQISYLLLRHNIDLVHFDMLHLAEYRKEIGSTAAILVNHNVESVRLQRWAEFARNPFLKLYLMYQQRKLKRFEAEVCPRFRTCVTVSDHDSSVLREMCSGGDFESIPNGVDVGYFYPNGTVTQPRSLVWTGGMQNPYNRDAVTYFLKQIWPAILRQVPEARVTFVGKRPPQPVLRLAQRTGNVDFAGFVDDVRPYVDQAAVFIAPIRAGSGTKIKVLNAMAQAKPVVTTGVGAEGIEAKPGEEIMIADDPTGFADKTIHLLKHPRAAKKMGLKARKVIEVKYDWQVINEKMNRLYTEVLNGKHS